MPENEIIERHITLVLTQACNLRCSYCYENYKTPKRIPLDLAKQIVDAEIMGLKENERAMFDLFGGEPFLAFDTLKEIVEYAERKGYMDRCFFFATTNGTLVHGEIADWVKAHKDSFWPGLSLDGNKKMHDINRSNSFDSIDLEFFAKEFPTQDIKMTISKESLPDLAEGVIFCHNAGFGVACNLAFNIDWSDKENETILERELLKLIDYYLEHPELNPCTLLAANLTGVLSDPNQPMKRLCGSGINMVAYDIDGKKYPCQFFMPNALGEGKAKQLGEIVIPEKTPCSLLDDKCQSCIARSICMICYGANYAATGSLFKKDDNMCRLSKIIFRANSFFLAKQWEKGQLNHIPEKERDMILKAISIIQHELK